MHGYKWPINCTRTRTALDDALSGHTAGQLRELLEQSLQSKDAELEAVLVRAQMM